MIANFFKEIGLAEELGSGIRKIVKYTKIYSNAVPKFRDDEIFKVKIPLIKDEEQHNKSVSIKELRSLILDFIKNSEGKARQEINEYIYPILNGEEATMNNRVRTTLTYLKKKELIENIGTDTKPMWISK